MAYLPSRTYLIESLEEPWKKFLKGIKKTTLKNE